MLAKAGICSEEALRNMGAIEAFVLVKQAGCNPSKNLLYAIYGALHDLPWSAVSSGKIRSRLLLELDAFEELF
jgi:DNA transformation protein